MASHNEKLKNLLVEVSNQVELAHSEDELLSCIDTLEASNLEIKFENKNSIIYAIVFATLGLISLFFYSSGYYVRSYLPFNHDTYLLAAIASGVAALIALAIIQFRKNQINAISNLIFTKDIYADNELSPIKVNAKSYARELGESFGEFHRGNHSREIRSLVEGKHTGEEHTFTYRYYQFHYVNKVTYYETTSDGNGGTRRVRRTRYDHYDRYGMLIDFQLAKSLEIVKSRGKKMYDERYKVASNNFNNQFKVYCNDSMDAARFLKPVIVLELVALASALRTLNLEFSDSGQLCVSFHDSNVLKSTRQFGIDHLAEFKQEIAGFTDLPKLKLLTESLHKLFKYSDNNFKD